LAGCVCHACASPVCPSRVCVSLIRPPPRSPLFPYTTLFRSVRRTTGEVDPAEAARLSKSKLMPEHIAGDAASVEYMMRFGAALGDRKSTRLNSSHVKISYAVFCLKKKKEETERVTRRTPDAP